MTDCHGEYLIMWLPFLLHISNFCLRYDNQMTQYPSNLSVVLKDRVTTSSLAHQKSGNVPNFWSINPLTWKQEFHQNSASTYLGQDSLLPWASCSLKIFSHSTDYSIKAVDTVIQVIIQTSQWSRECT